MLSNLKYPLFFLASVLISSGAEAVPIFERSEPELPITQFINPDEMSPERGPRDLDANLGRLSLMLVHDCIQDAEHRRLLYAYIEQLREADAASCASNLYFTDPDIIFFVRGLGTLAPLEHARACKALDDQLRQVFEDKERDAVETGICKVKRPLPRCVVTANGLRFRMFPHIANRPEVNSNLFTRLDGLDRGTQVVLGKAYRGWAHVSVALPSSNETRSSGWVSLEYLDCS